MKYRPLRSTSVSALEPAPRPAPRFVRRFHHAGLLALGAILFSPTSVFAFPPAPYYTVFGDVRDEFGYVVPANGSTIILYHGTKELGRHPVTAAPGEDFNYRIRMRLDMNRLGTSTYSSLALNSGAAFTLTVDIGGVLYYPIEVTATPPTVGAPADRLRINLTLGSDANRDGLPDAWQELQLYLAGLPTSDLSRVSPDGDLDGDGLSNRSEYIAGTYASDAQESFYLKITGKTDAAATVEFFSITNKTYSMEQSTDLASWSPVNFSADPTGEFVPPASATYVATRVGVVSAAIPSTPGEAKTFYRLNVR